MKGSCISTTQVVLSSLFCNVSFWLPSDWKSSKDVPRLNSSLEMLLHATFLALSHAYPRNYNHRCARFHFASLHLCPQLLCSSGPQESSPAFLGLKQGQSRTGPRGGVRSCSSSVVAHPSLPNLKTYLQTFPALSNDQTLLRKQSVFVTHSHLTLYCSES